MDRIEFFREVFEGSASMEHNEITNIRLNADGSAIVILDQAALPGETKFVELRTIEEMHNAISTLMVRGAPAIGIFAAFALYIVARRSTAENYGDFRDEIMRSSAFLNSSRPTAYNLENQLRRMEALVAGLAGEPLPSIVGAMRREAESIQDEDARMCRAISEYGLSLISDGNGVMTYCNAGPLATSRFGTALGPIMLAKELGWDLHVYSCETRPLLQGARLTAYELNSAGIDITLICDNMASIVMSGGKVDAVFAGCDRLARNGDAANKIGTSGLAIIARHYDVPFYVFCPSSTFDPGCATGKDIDIELRSQSEIKELHFSAPVAPADVKCYNPAFDVTDNGLITAIVTEKGIFNAPYDKTLAKLL